MYNYTTKKLNLFSSLLLIGIFLGFSTNSLQANKELNFEANGYYNSESSDLKIDFFHTYEEEDGLPEEYRIYYAVESNAKGDFDIDKAELLETVNVSDLDQLVDTTFNDFGIDGNLRFANYTTVLEVEFERYSFKIVAEIDGETRESNPFMIMPFDDYPKDFYFVDYPSQRALKNQLFEADFNVAYGNGNADDNVTYSLIVDSSRVRGPNVKWITDAEINSETGVMTWTPTESGRYYVTLRVELTDNKNEFTELLYQVNVLECEEETKILVEIVNQDGESPEGFIYAIGADENGFSLGNETAIIDGKAEFKLDKGDYKIVYYGFEEFGSEQWYSGANNIQDAQVISLDCGDITTIKMEVRDDISWEDRYKIKFTNENAYVNAAIDELMEYDVDAIYTDDESAEIKYTLIKAPEGVEIDSETGLISWIPNKKGSFGIQVRATLADDSFISNDFYFGINVRKCAEPAVVTGKISFEENENEPIWGFGFIIPVDQKVKGRFDFTQSFELNEGEFSVELDEGEYYLGVMLENTQAVVFYEDAINIEDAETIEVECGEEKEIELIISYDLYEKYTVEGSATDENGDAINAQITFEGRKLNAFGFEEYKVYTTSTDNDGNYEIELPNGFEYIAYARTANNRYPLYWEQTYNPNEAKVFKLESDKEDVNFVFEDITKDFTSVIKGSVTTEEGELIPNVVIVAVNMEKTAIGNSYGLSALSEDGNFELKVANGETAIFAFAQNDEYAPGFYVEGDVASFSWEDATMINVTEDSETEINVILEGMGSIAPGGIARIEGSVMEQGTNEMISGAGIILEQNNKPVMHANSFSDGSFGMSSLPNGSYKVIVNKVGYEKFETTINVTDNTPIDLDIPLVPQGTTSVEYGVDAETTVAPNPATENITLMLDENVRDARLMLLNINGEIMLDTRFSGNERTLDLRNYSNGSYILKLETENYTKAIPFVISK